MFMKGGGGVRMRMVNFVRRGGGLRVKGGEGRRWLAGCGERETYAVSREKNDGVGRVQQRVRDEAAR